MDKKIFNAVKGKIRKAVEDFSMFRREDKILVALSGGKDSLLLAYFLKQLGYSPDGLFIDLGIGNFSALSRDVVEEFSRRYGIRLHREESTAWTGFSIDRISGQYADSVCSVCGSVKRKIFNNFALKNGYDVLLTGHNMDDEARFLLSNNRKWNWAYLKKSYPVLGAKEGFIKRAKPLVYVRESQMLRAVKYIDVKPVEDPCPYSRDGNQKKYDKIFDAADDGFPDFLNDYYLNFLRNYSFLSGYADETILKKCSLCGDWTTSDVCKVCRVGQGNWRKKIDNTDGDVI